MEITPSKLPKDAHDFLGADAANDVRIASSYFTRICFPCKVQNPAYR